MNQMSKDRGCSLLWIVKQICDFGLYKHDLPSISLRQLWCYWITLVETKFTLGRCDLVVQCMHYKLSLQLS